MKHASTREALILNETDETPPLFIRPRAHHKHVLWAVPNSESPTRQSRIRRVRARVSNGPRVVGRTVVAQRDWPDLYLCGATLGMNVRTCRGECQRHANSMSQN
jgi:hypothetical protein